MPTIVGVRGSVVGLVRRRAMGFELLAGGPVGSGRFESLTLAGAAAVDRAFERRALRLCCFDLCCLRRAMLSSRGDG